MEIDRKPIIERILAKFDSLGLHKTALVGFDGYVDKIQRPVLSQKKSGNEYYPSLDRFGKRIREASGVSAQIELVNQVIKPGGNAPIMANALACLGVKNICIGTLGDQNIEKVFQEVHQDCKLVSIGKPGETNAIEFGDGKLILSELSAFEDLVWEYIKKVLGENEILDLFDSKDLLVLVDWCNLPHANKIWEGILNDLIVSGKVKPSMVFFDLADPSKKSEREISDVLSLIGRFSQYSNVTLGLNKNEAMKVYGVISRLNKFDVQSENNLEKASRLIFDHMSIDCLLIHPTDSCYIITADSQLHIKGKLVNNPMVSTGGGDNFNVGFCFGRLNSFSMEESVVLAMGTSGAYVQNGKSPNIEALKSFLTT